MASELLKIKGIGPVTSDKLGKLGIFTPEELIAYTPVDYIDLDAESDLKIAENGDFVVAVLFIEYAAKPVRRGKLQLFRARGVAADGSKLKLTWYNANYVSKIVHVGAGVRVYGKLKKENGVPELINPTAEVAVEQKGRGIKPIYRLKGLIGQSVFREAVRDAIEKGYTLKSLVPEAADDMPLSEAVRTAHLPNTVAAGRKAKERIELESVIKDIVAYRLVVGKRRRELFYGENTAVIDPVIDSLPYKLTVSQKAALGGILSGLSGFDALNAMLVGDVGSGKTIVALLTAYYAVKCGYQVALMAPTEILATQHFRTFSKILLPFGVKVALLTAGLPAKEKREIASAVAAGETDILIGTHALISGSVNFKNLSLAIIDEQHRFGVAERTALIAKSGSEDTLTLSATPIPRSLRLTVFGDVEVLNIERRYVGNVTTEVVVKAGKKAMLNAIAEECLRGRQAYVVAPRIRDIEGIESSSADRLYKELSKLYAGKLTVGLLHGKMKAAEKQAVLDGFYSGKISVIVSTTVIEVGIDVPNATIMAVFDADRFGLAALHQLRGRIGRNGDKGYCYLYTEKDADEQIRLKVMTEETDGLEIAERDLQIRGAGEWLGEEQSGKGGAMLPVRMMIRAKELADKVDPEAHKEELTAYALAKQLYKISLS